MREQAPGDVFPGPRLGVIARPAIPGRAKMGRDAGHALRHQWTEPEPARHPRAGKIRPLDARRRRGAVPRRRQASRLCGRVPADRTTRASLSTGSRRPGTSAPPASCSTPPPIPTRRSRSSTPSPPSRCRPSRFTSPTSTPARRFATRPMSRWRPRALVCGFGIAGYALAIDGLAALVNAGRS